MSNNYEQKKCFLSKGKRLGRENSNSARTHQKYMHLHERTLLHRIGDDIPVALASLYQPLAAGISWAVQIPKTKLGDVVLILLF